MKRFSCFAMQIYHYFSGLPNFGCVKLCQNSEIGKNQLLIINGLEKGKKIFVSSCVKMPFSSFFESLSLW